MNGVLIVDKPAGITSHDVIYRVRRILKIKSVGHTGTLDPFATGVLVVLIGNATRLARFLDKSEKEYLATVRFGFETDTGDRTGKPKSEVSNQKSEITNQEIENALTKYRGEIWQTPPMYSAKKIDGKKLYELARKGEEVAREPIKIEIKALELVEDSLDSETIENLSNQSENQNPQSAILRVVCSAGTYIRTLAEDLGRELNTGAHLGELRRTRAGAFDLSQAATLEELEKLKDENNLEQVLISPADALAHLPEIVLNADRARKTLNGLRTFVDSEFSDNQLLRMVDENRNLIAVGCFNRGEKAIQPRVVLRTDV